MDILDRVQILDERTKSLRHAKEAAAQRVANYATAALDETGERRAQTADLRDEWARRYSRLCDLETECRRQADLLFDRA